MRTPLEMTAIWNVSFQILSLGKLFLYLEVLAIT